MKKLFIHLPLFRLLSPLFSGTLVYLLILLINNNIGQLEETFLGQELYVCIGLAYLIQEYARLSLLVFGRIRKPESFLWRLLLQLLSSVVLCVLLVSAAMYLYFTNVLGYTPNSRELLIFNSIFSFITLIYVTVYISHQFLYKVNTIQLAKEVSAKEGIEADFVRFKNDINPKLLFETLEALLVLMKKDPEAAEQLSDHFSTVYRYLLSKKKQELIPVEEEITILKEFILLLNHLPYRRVHLGKLKVKDTLVVPGSLLVSLERIVRSTIVSEDQHILVDILEGEEKILLRYKPEEVLNANFWTAALEDVARNYKYYSDNAIQVVLQEPYKLIELPKLSLDENSHY